MPSPPLEDVVQHRRELLSPREVDRLSTYKRVSVSQGGSGGSRQQEVRTETAVARRFQDSILTAGTLLTVIGSVRYDRQRGLTMHAAGDVTYVGRRGLQALPM